MFVIDKTLSSRSKQATRFFERILNNKINMILIKKIKGEESLIVYNKFEI